MNTAEFFDHILPDIGLRVIVSLEDKKPRQKFCEGNYTASLVAQRIDATGVNTYHACATFAPGGKPSRKGDNAIAVKAFWLDIDAGPAKPYTSQREALVGLRDFCATLALPSPMVVSSGSGLHVYWVMDQNIQPATWLAAAQMLKMACTAHRLHADPTRTADIASVLRPVGTHNHKRNQAPVKILSQGVVTDIASFRSALSAVAPAVPQSDEDLGPQPHALALIPLDNSALIQSYDGPKPDAGAIVQACAIIREFHDSQGMIEEPLWRACMGVVAHCEGGPQLCHDWSSGHPGYTFAETQAKVDAVLAYPPTTRDSLERYRPDACAACTLRDTCKSPVKPGYAAARQMLAAEPSSPQAATIAYPTALTMPAGAPDGYTWTSHTSRRGDMYLTALLPPKEKPASKTATDPAAATASTTTRAKVQTPISDTLFYPFEKIKRSDNTYVLHMRAHSNNGAIQEFALDCTTIAEGGSKLNGILGANLVTCENGMASEIQRYLNRWIDRMRENAQTVGSYSRFGWHERNFLIGDTLLKADGSEAQVMLTGSAFSRRNNFIPRGSLDAWVALVDRAYNHDNDAPLQFALLTGLAAPLLKMFNDYGGVLVYLHSDGTGKGKTTIERAALSPWCSWEEIQMTHDMATSTAVYTLMGTLSNMPVVIDELTKIPNDEVGDLVRLISSGTPKIRCKIDGALADNTSRWSTFTIGSGNMLLTEKLALDRAHAEAEMVRIWEYTIAPNPQITPSEALSLFPQFSENCGYAGRHLARHIVDNYDDVKAQLFNTQQRLVTALGLTQEERYWTVLLSCVVTVLSICREIGLVNFPIAPILMFIKQTLASNRNNLKSSVVPMNDLLGQMLGDIWQGMLITQGGGHLLRGQDAYITQRPHGSVTGRVITPVVGSSGMPEVYVSSAVAKAWCNKRNVSAQGVFKSASAAGLVGPREKRFQLGSGSKEYVGLGGSIPCWEVLPGAAAHILAGVTPLNVLQGGRSKP